MGETKVSSLGDKICELRKQKGLSQEALGDIIGVSRQAISKWELGEMTPNWENISQLSKFFEVSLNYFSNDICVANEIASSQDVKQNYSNCWLVLSILGGIVALIFVAFTVCMGIIVLTSNTGDQTVQTTQTDSWALIVIMIFCGIVLIVETIFIIMAVKKHKCKH